MSNRTFVVVIGTRAEAIKLVPLYQILKREFPSVVLCATYQHTTMLDDVFEVFNVKPDYNLGVMQDNQDLFHITSAVLQKTKEVYLKLNPALVIVHGDTTTTMAAALSAFYLKIPIAHVEAGMRTGDVYSPYPEELNRKLVGQIATLHFAPSATSVANLLAEGIDRESIFCTGNTVVDALFSIKQSIERGALDVDPFIYEHVSKIKEDGRKLIVLTAHRRESFKGGLGRIFQAVKEFALQHEDVTFFFPVHPNPHVRAAVEQSHLAYIKNCILVPAVKYTDLVYLLTMCDFVATDSGGIQEEAVSLGKRVLCLRDVTERKEGVWEGHEIVVGTDPERIMKGLNNFYGADPSSVRPSTIYGDGRACERIIAILKDRYEELSIPYKVYPARKSSRISEHGELSLS